jgi:hypothetical protein
VQSIDVSLGSGRAFELRCARCVGSAKKGQVVVVVVMVIAAILFTSLFMTILYFGWMTGP